MTVGVDSPASAAAAASPSSAAIPAAPSPGSASVTLATSPAKATAKAKAKAATEESRFSLNVQGVLLHVAGDAMGSIAVILSGLLIKYVASPLRGLADPICSLAIVGLLVYGTVPTLRRSLAIVTQKTPLRVDVGRLNAKLRALEHVMSVSSADVAASATVPCRCAHALV